MKISVITVCFNSAAHIADALASVDAQSWPDLEHLIIDGGSNDDTPRVVQAHARPWRAMISEPDNGIYDAMNKGFRMAQGEAIGFINSDDFYADPEVLAAVAQAFSDPAIDACWGDLCYVRRDNPDAVVRFWRSSDFSPGLFAKGWTPPHPTLFIRRRVIDRLGGFDLSYRTAADLELMLRLIEVHRVRTRYLPRLMVKMRTGGTTGWPNVVRQNQEIWRALVAHGQRPSLGAFVGGKLLSRGKQFLTRPV